MWSKKILLLIGIVVFSVVCVFAFFFIKNLINDSSSSVDRMNSIRNYNNLIEKNVIDYNASRKTLATLLKTTYIDSFDSKKDNIFMLLDKELNYIKSTKNYVLELDKNCKGKMYADAYVNEICLRYGTNYESMVNVFVSDYTNINNMVTAYNESHDDLDQYSSVEFGKYIDYNGDGIYSGKGD